MNIKTTEGNWSNDYAQLELFKYSKDTLIPFAHKEFGSWRPISWGFWGSDNCFYIAVIPSAVNSNLDWTTRIEKRYNFRYVRIKIKGQTMKTE
jgi:hypothetical protein